MARCVSVFVLYCYDPTTENIPLIDYNSYDLFQGLSACAVLAIGSCRK